MIKTRIKNTGYLLVFLPLLTLIIGAYVGFDWVTAIFFFVVTPLLRFVIGNDRSSANREPSPSLLLFLEWIPRIYCIAWFSTMLWALFLLTTTSMSTMNYIGFGLGFWIVGSLTTTVGHELIHSKSKMDRNFGAMLNATVGYFHFAEEHINHHALTGHAFDGDSSNMNDSVYVYSLRRYLRTFVSAWDFEKKRLLKRRKEWFENRLFRKALIPLFIGSTFYYLAGITGLIIYLCQVLGVAFAVQAITYLQHWGLNERDTPELADFGFSWEDSCWLQACVTLNNAFHGMHHLHPNRPYYKLTRTSGGLPLPASYPVMFLVALYPSYFKKIMQVRLTLWTNNHQLRDSFNHNTDCIGAARLAKAALKR